MAYINCEECYHAKVCSYNSKVCSYNSGDVVLCEHWQPTVDVVEVVRCKDCKHRCSDKCPMYHEELQDYDDYGYKSVDVVATDNTIDDGFCDKGERRC